MRICPTRISGASTSPATPWCEKVLSKHVKKTWGECRPPGKDFITDKHHHSTLARTTYTSVDVARRAGVSRTAVSYVLNEDGVRSTHVSEETRAKVLQAVQELGYSTHSSARALRKGQSDEICIIVDLPLTTHRTELFVSVQQHAFLHGYSPVVYFSYNFSAEQVHSHLLKIFARRPIGIFATASSMTDEHITRILQGQGIQVTRRTVAKYREDMRIPSTHQRRVKS